MSELMKRREFITLLGGAAAWPLAARAQQPAAPVVGWLGSQSRVSEEFRVTPFRQGLKEAGYIEGQSVAIEYRWADGKYDRLPTLAADLVYHRVAAIAVAGIAEALAAKGATASIPIVFSMGGDPVRFGLVASLNRPGGNLTGVTSLNVEVGPKQFELLHELAPTATSIALLANPANAAQTESATRAAEAAARRLGLKLHVLQASTERDLDAVFATMLQLGAGALVISPESLFALQSERLGLLALRHAVPAIAPYREFAAAGGLMSYGTNITGLYRQLGVYTGRVLKGEKPADLPIQQAVKIEFVVNLKTAKSLGLDVPRTLIARADEVIE
jgi:putative ABC transport system substrate-binding protein